MGLMLSPASQLIAGCLLSRQTQTFIMDSKYGRWRIKHTDHQPGRKKVKNPCRLLSLVEGGERENQRNRGTKDKGRNRERAIREMEKCSNKVRGGQRERGEKN